MQPAPSLPYCPGQPHSVFPYTWTRRTLNFPGRSQPWPPTSPRPCNRSWIPKISCKPSKPKDKFGVVPGEPQSCGSAFFLPQLPPSLLLGPSVRPELLSGVVSEMRWVGAQLIEQQGPLHVPAQMFNPQHRVKKQRYLQASFSLCRAGSVRAGLFSPRPLDLAVVSLSPDAWWWLRPQCSNHVSHHHLPSLSQPSGIWGWTGDCAQRSGVCLLLCSLEAPLGPRLLMDGLGEPPAKGMLKTSLLALLSHRHVARCLSGDTVLAQLQG